MFRTLFVDACNSHGRDADAAVAVVMSSHPPSAMPTPQKIAPGDQMQNQVNDNDK